MGIFLFCVQLVLGNSLFVSVWMGMYELNTLKDRRKFADMLRRGLQATREFCSSGNFVYSPKLRSLLLELLAEKPSERISVAQMLEHPWLLDDPAASLSSAPAVESGGSASSSNCSSNGNGSRLSPLKSTGKKAPLVTTAMPVPNSPPKLQPTETTPTATAAATAAATSPGGISVRVRPISAEGKVSLPTIPSPEKPTGKRSPERTYSKRPGSGSSPQREWHEAT